MLMEVVLNVCHKYLHKLQRAFPKKYSHAVEPSQSFGKRKCSQIYTLYMYSQVSHLGCQFSIIFGIMKDHITILLYVQLEYNQLCSFGEELLEKALPCVVQFEFNQPNNFGEVGCMFYYIWS